MMFISEQNGYITFILWEEDSISYTYVELEGRLKLESPHTFNLCVVCGVELMVVLVPLRQLAPDDKLQF